MNIGVVGSGYVGLTTAATLAYLGHRISCVDIDEPKIAQLQRGELPIYEPHLAELFALVRHNLCFTTSYEKAIRDADIVFLTVGTPSVADGLPDLSFMQSAARQVARCLGPTFTVVVNKSTVPIGSGNWVEAIINDTLVANGLRCQRENVAVASNPEFLREGSALHDALYPDRVVIGADQPLALQKLYELYKPIAEQTFPAPRFLPRPESLGAVPVLTTTAASAELIKYAANAFLALKISFINEIGDLAEKAGADITQVAKGIGLDTRIGTRFLQAGIGWGGSCFGKDTAALVAMAQEYSLAMPIVEAAREVNYRQRERVVKKLLAELRILRGATIGLLGLAFKPDTDDVRDAPAFDIARRLLARGAKVVGHDPVAVARAVHEYPDVEICYRATAEQVAVDADALVLTTEWQEYHVLPWEQMARTMRTPVLIDGRNFLDKQRLVDAGFRYVGTGA